MGLRAQEVGDLHQGRPVTRAAVGCLDQQAAADRQTMAVGHQTVAAGHLTAAVNRPETGAAVDRPTMGAVEDLPEGEVVDLQRGRLTADPEVLVMEYRDSTGVGPEAQVGLLDLLWDPDLVETSLGMVSATGLLIDSSGSLNEVSTVSQERRSGVTLYRQFLFTRLMGLL